ncbi:hypothetical protein V1477_015207 [Vespula maculifrons]|uniref:Uncharacterized protein n=1 Tax=Vespula maculifrons TaxID=7453 RepID=A0ABD2BJM6_VESMC
MLSSKPILWFGPPSSNCRSLLNRCIEAGTEFSSPCISSNSPRQREASSSSRPRVLKIFHFGRDLCQSRQETAKKLAVCCSFPSTRSCLTYALTGSPVVKPHKDIYEHPRSRVNERGELQCTSSPLRVLVGSFSTYQLLLSSFVFRNPDSRIYERTYLPMELQEENIGQSPRGNTRRD